MRAAKVPNENAAVISVDIKNRTIEEIESFEKYIPELYQFNGAFFCCKHQRINKKLF